MSGPWGARADVAGRVATQVGHGGGGVVGGPVVTDRYELHFHLVARRSQPSRLAGSQSARTRNVRGPYEVIDTAVPGVQFSEICPNLARELGRFAVLRGWNPQNGSHGVADQWCMSGRAFNPGLQYPCVGSVVSQQFGFKSALPPFVQVGGDLSRDFNGGTPGILGLQHGAFEVLTDPNAAQFTVRDITPPGGDSPFAGGSPQGNAGLDRPVATES